MYALIGLPLLAPAALELIPEAAIDGILAYVGYEGIVCFHLPATQNGLNAHASSDPHTSEHGPLV